MDLQQRTERALESGYKSEYALNCLLKDLADAKETNALVRVWDIRNKATIYPETMSAMESLHNMGKGKIPEGTIVLASDRTRLAPARRLHKIFKGQVLSSRSEAAKQYIVEAAAYLSKHPEIKTMKKGEQIKVFRNELNMPNDTARGLVTKLKQKKLL
jgi:hypothetical protein